MAVQKPQTAWDVLAKMVRTAVRTRFETKGCGSKQKENERFAWDFLTKMIRTAVRKKGMAVQTPQTAWDTLAKKYSNRGSKHNHKKTSVSRWTSSQIHTTAKVIETTLGPTMAFQCIAAVTSAMTKKGQTLITPMDDLTPPCGTDELVVVPSFFQ